LSLHDQFIYFPNTSCGNICTSFFYSFSESRVFKEHHSFKSFYLSRWDFRVRIRLH